MPVLSLSALAVVISAQTSCGGSVEPGPPLPGADAGDVVTASCRDGESSQMVASMSMCCRSTGNSMRVCYTPVLPRVGDACTSQGATGIAADEVDITDDVCVIDSCNGDHTSEAFAADVALTQSASSSCTLTAAGLAWQRTGVVQKHRVERACIDHGTHNCGVGYGYYGATIDVRSVGVTLSVCATSTAPSEIACPQGSL